MPSLRSIEGKKIYKEYLKNVPATDACALCSMTPLQKFKYWKITKNNFPYDLIASTHHIIMPIRHVTESELTNAERKEFAEIKMDTLEHGYDYIIEATIKNKSIPGHFHQHLIVGKSSEPGNK